MDQQYRVAGKRWIAPSLVASLAAVAWGGPTTGPTEPDVSVKTASLRHAVLPNADCVVSRPAEGVPNLVLGRYVIPRDMADFVGDDRSVSLDLRGEPVVLLRDSIRKGKWAFALRAGRQLAVAGEIDKSTALQSATINLSDRRAYTLAFPHHFSALMQNQMHSQVWYRSGAVEIAKVGGAEVLFYDSDCDGRYRMQADSMRVGTSSRLPVFAPITPHFATERGVYHIEGLSENGGELRYTTYGDKTGKLAVTGPSQGLDIQLVLQSKEADLAMVCSASQPAVMAIPGTYEMIYGVVGDAEGNMVAAIQPGSVAPVEVVAGKLQTVRIVGPIALDFKASLKDDKLQIDPGAFRFRGKNGEQYVKTQWAQPPEIAVRRGRGIKRVGKMAFG